MPRVRDVPEGLPGENWREALVRRGIRFCRKHLLYIAPSNMPPDDALNEAAQARGVRILHVPTQAVSARSLAIVARDEHEWSPNAHRDLRDIDMEIFSLHARVMPISPLCGSPSRMELKSHGSTGS